MAKKPRLLKITCRIEEVPTIGRFLLQSLSDDLADFIAFSPIFNAPYSANAQAALTAMEALIFPRQLTAELKVITLHIAQNMAELPQKIDFVEFYAKKATGLTVAWKDFGFSAVRKDVARDDQEGLVSSLKYMLNLVNDPTNLPLLQATGYTAGLDNALQQIKSDMQNDNTAQNAKINQRNNLVNSNATVINAFWDTLREISDAGKRINKKSNKKDDYTVAELKRRIRREQKKNKMNGTVTSATNIKLYKAKLTLTPVLGGRKRTTVTKTDGTFEMKSLASGDYILTVTLAGYVSQSIPVTVLTGQTTTQDFVLVPV